MLCLIYRKTAVFLSFFPNPRGFSRKGSRFFAETLVGFDGKGCTIITMLKCTNGSGRDVA
ncbi:hypothetical protein TFUB4_00479 [Tannerella forsythia]|nr:hypothetical protein TFUB4_00479 [Tannerella forsythia]